MATIEKLGITGIRSYNNESLEVIEFFKPLTLILGKNGAGKTTIIESLRFAICGVLPPSSNNGKSFLNDPRLKNQAETKAAVKLRFKAINGKDVICSRIMQYSVTNKRDEFRKTEQYIKIKHPNGEMVTIGHTCTEIDKQMPELLGLSKAVIENVVLCHQEDSLWPFSDNMTLKKVFDDLFDTTKVTKFAEQVKAVIKEKKKHLRDSKYQVDLAKRDYDAFVNLQKELSFHISNYLETQNKIKELNANLADDKNLEEFNNLQRDIGKMTQQKQSMEDNLRQLKDRQREFLSSVDEEYFMVEAEELKKDYEKNSVALEYVKKDLNDLLSEMKESNLDFLKREVNQFNLQYYKKNLQAYELANIETIKGLLNHASRLLISNKGVYDEFNNKLNALDNLKLKEREELEIKKKDVEDKIELSKKKEVIEQYQQFKIAYQNLKENIEATEKKRGLITNHINETELDIKNKEQKIEFLNKCRRFKLFTELKDRKSVLEEKLELNASDIETINFAVIENKINMFNKEKQGFVEVLPEIESQVKTLYIMNMRNEKEIERLSRLKENHKNTLIYNGIKENEEDLYDKYKRLKNDIEQDKTKHNLMNHSGEFLHELFEISTQKGRCFLCESSLKNMNVNVLEKRAQEKIELIQSHLDAMSQEINTKNEEYNKLKSFKTILKECFEISQEVKKIEEQIKTNANQVIELNKSKQEFEDKKNCLERKISIWYEYQDVILKIDDVGDKKDFENFIMPGNFEEVDIAKLEKELNNLKLTNTKNYQSLLQLESNIKDSQSKVEMLKIEIAKFGINDENEVDIADKKLNIRELEGELNKTRRALENLELSYYEKKKSIEAQKKSLMIEINELEGYKSKIETYINSLQKSNFSYRKVELEKRLADLNILLTKLQSAMDLKEVEDEINKVKEDLKILNQQLKALTDREYQLQRIKAIYEEKNKEVSELMGKKEMLASSINSMTVRIENEKENEVKYAVEQLGFEVTKLKIEDLEIVLSTIENSLVQFHSEKIEQINKIIDNIWKLTYTGDDIDYVRIRSEVSLDEGMQANKKNYNYRIVFVNKEGKELSMKGRCSAGQKVLASIVIRLALSEAFCLNCGLLALDEPTTNLDPENISYLADFLKKLIKTREEEQSFQLIIITHDKDFVKFLGSEASEYYYIFKDETGYSRIQKESIDN